MENRTKIKTIIALSVSLLFFNAITLSAQAKIGKIGLTFSSFGENPVYNSESEDLLGAPSYSKDNFFSIGVTYVRSIYKWLEFETGVEYSKHHIIVHPNLPPQMDNSPHSEEFALIGLPFALRANFLRFFFFNAGGFLDFESGLNSPIDSQSGLGILLGIAIKYDFNFGLSVFVNKYGKVHAVVPFHKKDYQQRVWESGLRLGVSYRF